MELWMTLLVALLFMIFFGGLSLVRKEPVTIRFAAECLGLTALAYLIYWTTHYLVSPVLFLFILYIVTMRAQILIDLGTYLARRGNYGVAERLYEASQRLGVGGASSCVARINLGTCYLKEQRLEDAEKVLRAIADDADKGLIGPKHEAACRYNLGLVLLRSGKTAEAVRQLNKVEELLPASMYGVGARAELKRYREGISGTGKEVPPAPGADAGNPKQEA